jgi:NitT/TauT family transport system ATP-binding protein
MSEIVFDHVGKVFPRGGSMIKALDDINLTIGEREFVAVVGPSGCGKTTLLRMVAGLEMPSSGAVRVGGKVVRKPGPDRAVVFQQFALFPWKTVRENIAFGLKCKGVDRRKRDDIALKYLELMSMAGTEDSYPHQLSGGMQQRVAIARSYAIEPDVLLMDEPFGALDAQTRTVMQEELMRVIRVNPRTVLFITHSVEEALFLADRVIVLSRGPGSVTEIIPVRPVREEEKWLGKASEEVMETASFGRLRAHIWKLLRQQMQAGLTKTTNEVPQREK